MPHKGHHSRFRGCLATIDDLKVGGLYFCHCRIPIESHELLFIFTERLTGMAIMPPMIMKLAMPVSLTPTLSRKRARGQTNRCASFTLIISLSRPSRNQKGTKRWMRYAYPHKHSIQMIEYVGNKYIFVMF